MKRKEKEDKKTEGEEEEKEEEEKKEDEREEEKEQSQKHQVVSGTRALPKQVVVKVKGGARQGPQRGR